MGILVTPFGGPKSESDNVIKLGDSAQFSQAVYNKSYAIGVALFRFYNTLLNPDEISINYQAFQTRFDL